MILCFLSLPFFSFLGIFSSYYRKLAKEAFKCALGKPIDKRCEVAFSKKIKSKVVAKISKLSPKLSKVIERYLDMLD